MQTVFIRKGSYRNQEVKNVEFPLIKGFQIGAKGGFVTVDGTSVFGEGFDKIRVKVDNKSYELFGKGQEDIPAADATQVREPVKSKPEETDEQVMQRIADRFAILDTMTDAILSGDIRAMIVSGPPGVGKSFGVEQKMEKSGMFDQIAGKAVRYEVVKGTMSDIGLYQKLYEFHRKGDVLVFDDCDSILFEDDSLNMLKSALDSGKKRVISYNKESHVLREKGIENSFEFKGSAIFITNIKFESVRSKNLQQHLLALQSRCHFLDLTLDTMRDKFLRIKQIVQTGALWEGYDFTKEQEQEILDFMYENREKLREMSLRMGLKIGDLAKISKDWKQLAKATCMFPE